MSGLFQASISKSDARRYEIALAYIKSVASAGIEGATLERVAKSMKVTRPHLLYYFKSKEELLELSLKVITVQAQQITVARLTAAGRGTRDQLQAWVGGAFEWAREYPEQASMMLFVYQACTWNTRMRELYGMIRAQGNQRMAQVLLADPALKLDPDEAGARATTVQWIIAGALNLWASSGFSKSLLAQMERDAWRIVLREVLG